MAGCNNSHSLLILQSGELSYPQLNGLAVVCLVLDDFQTVDTGANDRRHHSSALHPLQREIPGQGRPSEKRIRQAVSLLRVHALF